MYEKWRDICGVAGRGRALARHGGGLELSCIYNNLGRISISRNPTRRRSLGCRGFISDMYEKQSDFGRVRYLYAGFHCLGRCKILFATYNPRNVKVEFFFNRSICRTVYYQFSVLLILYILILCEVPNWHYMNGINGTS